MTVNSVRTGSKVILTYPIVLASLVIDHGLPQSGSAQPFTRDLARTQQKGGGGLVHQIILTFLAFHCNHIKLNSPKKGGGRRGAE